MNSAQMFRGTHTAIITPFNSDGSFDQESFSKIIQQQLNGKVNGIVVLGTTGEAPTVEFDELQQIFSLAKKEVNNRVPLTLGFTSNNTASLLKKAELVKVLKPDAILTATPYYNKPTQKGLMEHFTAIAKAFELPILLYNVPGRSVVNIAADTVIALSKIPNIIGIKEASGDLIQVKKIIEGTGPEFVVLSGNDEQNIEIIKLGGQGAISVASNAVPGVVSEMISAALQGNFEKADAMDKYYRQFMLDIFIENNPQAIKTLMAHMGLCKEVFRLPMTTMLPENKKAVIESWNKISAQALAS